MTALPGTPAIQNVIPMPYFGTTPFAAPGLGVICALVMGGLGTALLMRRAATARRAGEGCRTTAQSSRCWPSASSRTGSRMPTSLSLPWPFRGPGGRTREGVASEA